MGWCDIICLGWQRWKGLCFHLLSVLGLLEFFRSGRIPSLKILSLCEEKGVPPSIIYLDSSHLSSLAFLFLVWSFRPMLCNTNFMSLMHVYPHSLKIWRMHSEYMAFYICLFPCRLSYWTHWKTLPLAICNDVKIMIVYKISLFSNCWPCHYWGYHSFNGSKKLRDKGHVVDFLYPHSYYTLLLILNRILSFTPYWNVGAAVFLYLIVVHKLICIYFWSWKRFIFPK